MGNSHHLELDPTLIYCLLLIRSDETGQAGLNNSVGVLTSSAPKPILGASQKASGPTVRSAYVHIFTMAV